MIGNQFIGSVIADEGSLLQIRDGHVWIIENSFESNQGGLYGPIYLDLANARSQSDDTDIVTRLTIVNSSFIKNSGQSGGAIAIIASDVYSPSPSPRFSLFISSTDFEENAASLDLGGAIGSSLFDANEASQYGNGIVSTSICHD